MWLPRVVNRVLFSWSGLNPVARKSTLSHILNLLGDKKVFNLKIIYLKSALSLQAILANVSVNQEFRRNSPLPIKSTMNLKGKDINL